MAHRWGTCPAWAQPWVPAPICDIKKSFFKVFLCLMFIADPEPQAGEGGYLLAPGEASIKSPSRSGSCHRPVTLAPSLSSHLEGPCHGRWVSGIRILKIQIPCLHFHRALSKPSPHNLRSACKSNCSAHLGSVPQTPATRSSTLSPKSNTLSPRSIAPHAVPQIQHPRLGFQTLDAAPQTLSHPTSNSVDPPPESRALTQPPRSCTHNPVTQTQHP